ncbi:GNAT family N-acetyltransferase [Fructilactobacillus sp. Tb1]|uniref:GNAT family N-acetyltransferase n=1 Tax=Fructilactobacillus sp. Tb1 TaxID=3422304 RepID=UPI003D2C0144
MLNKCKQFYLKYKQGRKEEKIKEALQFQNRVVTIGDVKYFLGKGMMTDVPDILKLDQSAYGINMKWSKARFLAELKNSQNSFYLILRKNDELVGFVCIALCRNEKCAHIENVAIKPGLQGHGLGYFLVTTVIQRARLMGLEHIDVTCRVNNIKTQDLFKDLGFVQVEIKPKYYPDGTDAVCLRLHFDKTNYIGSRNFGR